MHDQLMLPYGRTTGMLVVRFNKENIEVLHCFGCFLTAFSSQNIRFDLIRLLLFKAFR